MFIDIHRHSEDKGGADLVLRNIFHSETNRIGSAGFYSVGLHPWHVKESTLTPDIEHVKNSITHPNVIALGEAGIDKVIVTEITLQKLAFEMQLAMAKEADKPVIVHCVRAYDEILHYRKEANHTKPWIFHWFNASRETADDLIQKGCYLSFGHMLFKEESKAFKTFQHIPLEYIFLETDDADVTIQDVYLQAAKLRNISLEELKFQLQLNFKTCFGITI